MNKALITILTLTTFILSTSGCSLLQNNTKTISVPVSQNNATETQSGKASRADKKKTKKKNSKKTNAMPKGNVSQQSSTTNISQISDDLLSGEWIIYEVNLEKIEGEERPYIYFNIPNHRFYGSNGCNTINGDFSVKADSISLSNIISTQKACHDAPYEYQINYALGQITKYDVIRQGNEHYLNLYDSNNIKVLVLRRHNMDYLNGTWQVIGISGISYNDDKLKIVIDIPELKLHGNTGCNVVNGQLLIDPDKENSIQFHQLITTRMVCPTQSLETAFLVALEEVEAAKLSEDGSEVSMLDKKGNEVLRLKK